MNTKVLTLLHTLIACLVFVGSIVAGARASRTEGLVCCLPALLFLSWFVCSIALLLRRKWAWWGSFGSVLMIYGVLAYSWLLPVPRGAHSDPSGFLNLIGLVLMVPLAFVIVLLLVVRRHVLTPAL
jgi:hypothetical protein